MNVQKYTTVTVLLVTLLLLPAINIYSQSADQNYIVTKTYTSTTASNDAVQYYDGLGRPIQTVQKQFTPSGKDLVIRREYDPFGREWKNWLPVNNGNTNGNYDNTTGVAAGYGNDAYAYSEIKYEPSPLNRVDEQYGPGQVWRNNTRRVKTEYLTNAASGDLVCPNYFIQDVWTLKKNGNYAAGQLYVTKLTDEDNNVSYEFKDKLGKVLLQRQIVDGVQYNTNYVYDDFGNLCCVLPPMLSDKLTADNVGYLTWGSGPENEALTHYCYWFSYDSRNRQVSKFIAGAGTNFAYDNADRLVLERTPELEFIFTKYDAFGRVILSGLYTGTNRDFFAIINNFTNSVSKEQPDMNNQTNYYYTWNTFPSAAEANVTQVNYYDNYNAILKWDANLQFVSKTGYDPQYPSAKGLLTGTRSRLLDGVAGSNNWITTALYYDDKGNLVQKRSTNQMGGYDNEYYAYNYNSLITKKYIEHSASGQPAISEEYGYSYDTQLRPTTVTYSFLGATPPATIAQYTYDELGRVKTKTTGGLETTTYAFNIRGWEESRTGARFEEKLTYTNNLKSGGKNYFGGNIASMTWRTPTVSNLTDTRGYAFEYDALGRLKNAAYGEGANLALATKNYSESFTYDKNGNPLTLQRYGRKDNGSFGLIDDLSMPAASYIGNCLREVIDAAGDQSSSDLMEFKDGITTTTKEEYIYNSSGAITADYNRRICQFAYNYLLWPQSVQWRYGNRIEYVYDATGMRRTATYKESNKDMAYGPTDNRVPAAGDFLPSPLTKQYMGNKVYENNKLKYILTEEGYIEKTANNDYYTFYYLKDRLGNNRVVMNFNGVLDQVNNYYPSGVTMAESPYRVDQYVQPYKFGGKELDRFKNLDFYNFEARAFDPTLMRFMRLDPLAEKYFSVSPYAYCANNPVNAYDLNGDSIWYTRDDNAITMHVTGKVINQSGDNINVKRAASDITAGITDAFSGKVKLNGETYTLKTDVQLEAVSSMDDVASSDHLFVLLDGNGQEGSARGATDMDGGKVMNIYAGDYANDNWFSNTFSWNNTRSAVHEFGHAAGLSHESASGRGNLMTLGGSGTNITYSQRTIMWNRQNIINRGPNSYNFGREPYPYYHFYENGKEYIIPAYKLFNMGGR